MEELACFAFLAQAAKPMLAHEGVEAAVIVGIGVVAVCSIAARVLVMSIRAARAQGAVALEICFAYWSRRRCEPVLVCVLEKGREGEGVCSRTVVKDVARECALS